MRDSRFVEKYFLTDEQIMLRESAQAYATQLVQPRADELDTHDHPYPRDLMEEAGKLGFFRFVIA